MIVPMKKATLFALKQDRDVLLQALQRCGEFMIIPVEEGEELTGYETAVQEAQKVENTLGFILRYQGKKSFLQERTAVEYDRFMEEDPKAVALSEEAEALAQEMNAIRGEIEAAKGRAEQLEPWLPLDIPVSKLVPTQTARFFTGYLPLGGGADALAAAEEAGADVQPLGMGSEGRAVLITCHKADAEAVMETVKSEGFTESSPPRIDCLPQTAYKRAKDEIKEGEAKLAALEEKARELAKRKEELETLCDQLRAESARLSTRSAVTDATFCLTGWVRSDRMERVQKAVERTTDAFDLTFTDPAEDEKPPTVEKNRKLVTPFETITDMFSRPDPGETDPNPVMAPWYWLIFGMMMADVGYGVVMAILFYAFKKIKKPRGEFGKLVTVLLYASITTAFWGVMFGSYFGAEWFPPLLFIPLDNAVSTLFLCCGIGVLHIFSGMAIAMCNSIKAGHFWDAIFDQFSWMLLLGGLCLLLAGLSTVGMIVALVGAGIILVTAGRNKPGFIKKITGGLFGLYNITGYASDILSYSRILALALSSGVVAMVMNLLAGMVQGSVLGFIASIFIYIIGHVFNLVMGLLSAYVHASRLQYIEFFGKFYEGNGYAFEPLSIRSKYVDVIDK